MEAALRPNLSIVSEKSQDQLDLQALHRVRSRLVSCRTDTINQIRMEENCINVMVIPGIGSMISTAMVAAIGTGEVFERDRDLYLRIVSTSKAFAIDRLHGRERLRPDKLTALSVKLDFGANAIMVRV